MYALDYPSQVEEPPVVTPPDVIPGTVVQIPDPNLRTAIAEALRKSPNAPITAEEMKRLKDLDLGDSSVRDLTGLQFATHLRELNLTNNQVSDLSPIAGLIELRQLWVRRNPIADMSPVRGLTNLTHLWFGRCQVSDISPVRALANLIHLDFEHNPVSDISPIMGLTNLRRLEIQRTLVSDLSPVARLINLEELIFHDNTVSDLSPVSGLTNLKFIHFGENNVSDVSPLARLVNLEHIRFSVNEVSDISAFAGLINLKHIRTWGNPISDLTPLARLTKMEDLDICGARLQNASLAPLAGLTSLKQLYLAGNGISDISPIAGLTGLNRLSFEHNNISDISTLSGFTNLKWLNLADNRIPDISALSRLNNLTWLDITINEISDFSPLDGLRENLKLFWHINPGYPIGGTKIEGPWLWVALPDARLQRDADLLSEATGGKATEVGVATHGATVGKPVGDDVWRFDILPSTDRNNIGNMLKGTVPDHGVTYGFVSLYSPREQETTMYVGNDEGLKVWLNGDLVYEVLGDRALELNYNDFFPVTLKQGRNVLLVAVFSPRDRTGAFFGFAPSADYTVITGVDYAFSKSPIHVGDTFTLDVRAENVPDMAGWQFDIDFNPEVLQAVEVSEGDFLKSGGGATFFRRGGVDNTNGKITGFSAARTTTGGASGSGSLLQVTFKARSDGETRLALQNLRFGSATGEEIPAGPHEIRFTVQRRLPTGDVNRDGSVDILDLILVAQQLGKNVAADSPVDINGDGVVNIFDLTLVAQGIGGAAAPGASMDATIEAWISLARLEDNGSVAFRQGIANLENLLVSLIPQETALHANYPNPFNPETWIPYQLAVPADVTLTIHDMNGVTVRHFELERQAAGMYRSRNRAVYWDGRNGRGESVASGLYFYTLKAGEFAATRKMLIRK